MEDRKNSQIAMVLIHGAFADGSCWSKVIPLLEAKGINAVVVQKPLNSLADDVAATKRVLDSQDGAVVLADKPRPDEQAAWRAWITKGFTSLHRALQGADVTVWIRGPLFRKPLESPRPSVRMFSSTPGISSSSSVQRLCVRYESGRLHEES